MLNSPQANLFKSILDRIKSTVPDIRFIDHDLGQLENYEIRPSVSWPCCLIDIDKIQYSDADSNNEQMAQGTITLRLGLVKYTDSNNLTPANVFENSLKYYEIENEVFKALHGWNPEGFSKLLRRVAATEKRDDDIRVRVITFDVSYRDAGAAPVKTTIPRPATILSGDILP